MSGSSRKVPEKQRAPLAPTREPLPESSDVEEQEARRAANATRATLAAADAASTGAPGGMPPSAALSLARRVGNRRFGQWVERQRNARDVAGQPRPESATGDDSYRMNQSPTGQVAGATATVTPPSARSRVGTIGREWDETGTKLGPELTPSGTMPNPFGEQGKKWGPELTPSGTMPNPFEETTERPADETSAVEQATTPPLLSSPVSSPFGDTEATGPTTESEAQATTPLTPSGLKSNPYGDTKATGPSTPSGLRSNPYGDTKATGTQALPGTSETKAGSSAEVEAQGTVTQMEHDATALEGRDTRVLGSTPTSGEQVEPQAQELASSGQAQAATEDHTAREEAAAEEQATIGHGTGIEHEVATEEAPAAHEVPLEPGAEQALQRARQLIESTVLPLVAMLNPVGGVLAALRAIGGTIATTARFLSRALTPVWRTITSGIGSVITQVTERAASMLSAARRAAERVIDAVTSVVGAPAEAALARIRQLRAAAYGRVVQMVRNARERGVSRLTSMVGEVTTLISNTGQQIRKAITQAANAVANALRAARAGARAELDRMLGRSGPASAGQTGQLRARLRAWARRRLQALPRAVASGRTSTVSALRTALNDAVGIAREVWSEAASGFREMFAAPLAQAREHVPELVGEVELGAEQGEGLFGQATGVADQELAGVEGALVAAEARLQAEADQTGQSL